MLIQPLPSTFSQKYPSSSEELLMLAHQVEVVMDSLLIGEDVAVKVQLTRCLLLEMHGNLIALQIASLF